MLKNREGQGVPQTIFRTRHNHEWVDVTSDDVFSRGMGMLVPRNDLGFGERSWRYSMLVKDGVIEKMFIEPDVAGDPFEVSDADTILNYIAPGASKPLDVTVFTRVGCPYCVRAKGLLHDAGIRFEELALNRDFTEATLRAVAARSTVPQVFINGDHIGGSEELEQFLNKAEAAWVSAMRVVLPERRPTRRCDV